MKRSFFGLAVCGVMACGFSASFEANAACKPPSQLHDTVGAHAPTRDCITSAPTEPVQVCIVVTDAATGVLVGETVGETVEECAARRPLEVQP